jgi:hypothetical protein
MPSDVGRKRRRVLSIPLLVAAGCTSILDIDGRYVAITGSNGGRPGAVIDAGSDDADKHENGGTSAHGTGGEPETGGAVPGAGGMTTGAGGTTATGGTDESGGMIARGGALASGGAGGVADCAEPGNECTKGQKCCGSPAALGSACYVPSPLVGCGDTGCDYCANPVPTNSTPSCVSGKCSFTCDPGYVQQSGACVAMGSGGASGTGGITGSGGATSSDVCQRDKDCSIGCSFAGPSPCCMPNHMCGCTFFSLQVGSTPPIGYCLPRPPGFGP